MSVCYSVFGSLTLIDCEKSRLAVSKLTDNLGDIDYHIDDSKKGFLVVEIGGTQSCSYSTASEIEDSLGSFSVYAIKSSSIKTECDGVSANIKIERNESLRNVLSLSIAIQNASNFVGVIGSVREDLVDPLVQSGLSPDEARRTPMAVLWASKISDMTGLEHEWPREQEQVILWALED